jgi:hypothetical protein
MNARCKDSFLPNSCTHNKRRITFDCFTAFPARPRIAHSPKRRVVMKVQGIEGMSADRLQFEIQRGGKFVFYQYAISVLVMSFRRSSDVYFIPAGESAITKGLPWSLISLVAGWWGIPWGPIFTIQSLVTNFKGGKDVTAELSARMTQSPSPAAIAAKA